MTNEEITRTKAICAAATPPPWREGTENVWNDELGICVLEAGRRYYYEAGQRHYFSLADPMTEQEDCCFAAEARELLPKAMADIERMQAALEEIQGNDPGSRPEESPPYPNTGNADDAYDAGYEAGLHSAAEIARRGLMHEAAREAKP